MSKSLTKLAIIFLTTSLTYSQQISLRDLENICEKSNWESVNQFCINKNWEYYDSEKGNSEKYSTITWAFNKSYGDIAEGWLYLFTYDGFPNKISYSVFNKPSYLLVQNSIKSSGYKLKNSEIRDNEIITTYSNKTYLLEVSTEKRENNSYSSSEKSITAYNFLLIKKSSVYDPNNGKKTNFYYGDVKKIEYYLKDGKLEGNTISYYSNGNKMKTGTYRNDKKNGIFKEYSESGILEFEYFMKDDELNGPFKTFYDNGNLKKSGFFLNGEKNGKFIEYNIDGKKDAEYTLIKGLKNGILTIYEDAGVSTKTKYLDDKKNGRREEYYYNDQNELYLKLIGSYLDNKKNGSWEFYTIEDNVEKKATFTNYVEGYKTGAFQEVQGDSLIIGNYKNGKLNGKVKYYLDIKRSLFGGTINTDISELTLINEGEYINDLKSKNWKYYDLSGALRSEGSYDDDKKTGEWKYYYSKFLNEEGNKTYSYSEKLFLIENYIKGNLFGISKRFSSLRTTKYLCVDKSKDELNDTCVRYIFEKLTEVSYYKNNKFEGEYILKDSLNEIIASGYFNNGQKTGDWTQKFDKIDFEGNPYSYFGKGKYEKNKRNGVWLFYYEKDKIIKSISYIRGLLSGKMIEWDEDGNKISMKYFRNNNLNEMTVYDSQGLEPIRKYYILEIYPSFFKCEFINYESSTTTSQVYSISTNENEVIHEIFEETFFKRLENNIQSEIYRDGEFKILNSNNKPEIIGEYYKDEKYNTWTYYFYSQKVKIEIEYYNNQPIKEKYFTVEDELFSGEFTKIDDEKGIKEIISIKNGLRNGKTEFIDIRTGEIIEKVKYKNGEKK